MEETNYKKGFNKGLGQILTKDLESVKKEAKAALRIKNRNSYYYYRDGKIEPKASQAEALEKVFAKYGITDIWGE
jgi:hypothetical protein